MDLRLYESMKKTILTSTKAGPYNIDDYLNKFHIDYHDMKRIAALLKIVGHKVAMS